MYITTESELKEYILRQLGSESHSIEISDTNWSDIFTTNLKYIQEYVEDAVNKKYVITNFNKEKDIFLDSNVMAVTHIYLKQESINTNYFYRNSTPIYNFITSGDYNTSSYYIFTDQIKGLKDAFSKRVAYTFNSESKRLLLGSSETEALLEIYEVEDKEYLFQHTLFLKLLERACWKVWRVNAGAKYLGNTIGNGITINVDFMKEQEETLTEEINKLTEEESFDFLGPVKI